MTDPEPLTYDDWSADEIRQEVRRIGPGMRGMLTKMNLFIDLCESPLATDEQIVSGVQALERTLERCAELAPFGAQAP